MNSDTEHLSLWKDYAYKVNVQIQEISHCVVKIKQHTYLTSYYNSVSPRVSVQCLPSSKRIQKNRFGHYLQEHVISELSKLRV